MECHECHKIFNNRECFDHHMTENLCNLLFFI
jgi:hypothetical protein